MATARLSDSQKQELVRRFRQGESTQSLADHHGCSSTTITRLVKAVLTPEDYAALREQRQKKAGRDRQIPLAIDAHPAPPPVTGDPEPATADPNPTAPLETSARGLSDIQPVEVETFGVASAEAEHSEAEGQEEASAADGRTDLSEDLEEDEEPEAAGIKVLAIDDAEDFTDDGDSEEDLLLDGDGDGDGDGPFDSSVFHPVAVLPLAIDDQRETRPAPWTPEVLPSCAYLLVDKTVELQALPLASIPELGRLPSEEQNQQALVLFTNPRHAKRQCGRTQRVIKLPDPGLLGRTAPYLRAQGISRVVIEGALYALPGGL